MSNCQNCIFIYYYSGSTYWTYWTFRNN